MILKEHSIVELEAVRTSVEKFVAGGVKGAVFDLDDVKLIGAYVGTYSFIELNLRRAVKLFAEAGGLTPKEAKSPTAAGLVGLVQKGLSYVNLSPAEAADVAAYLTELAFRQPFRNMLAHWALKHMPASDVLVFVTMDDRDAKQISPEPPVFNGMYYAFLFGADLRGLTHHIIQLEKRLAADVAAWQQKLFPGVDSPAP